MEKQVLYAIKSLEKKVVDLYSKVRKVNSEIESAGNLQAVTDLGNTTTNDIGLLDNAKVTFDNGSRMQKGTTNSGNGGNGGISQVCSIDYELKWEAGRQYVLHQDGFTIREVRYNFTILPGIYDDVTKGFVVDSRWVLDNGDVYVCTDNTEEEAVWVLTYSTSGIAVRWSPIFQATGLIFTGTDTTYPTYNSYYVKSGLMVSFVIEIDFTTVTNFGTGQYKVELPFTPAFGYNHFSGWIWADPNVSPDTGTGHTILNADTAGITTVLDLHYLKQSGGANSPIREGLWIQGTPVPLTTISKAYINGTYICTP